MFYYINNSYEDGHVDYIQSPRHLSLPEITEEEYKAKIKELEESADGNSETETA